MSEILVRAENLHKRYTIDSRSIDVLKDINLSVDCGETIAIVGPSGAGKSTLLHQLGLLEKPTGGKIFFSGRNVEQFKEQEISEFRLNRIGFVFQFHHLLPEFTALENVMIPRMISGESRKKCAERADRLLEKVGLAHRGSHKPGELSGGEQQRVSLARALVNSPSLILADEPTGNLDQNASQKLQTLLWDICRDQGAALLLVTHNLTLAKDASRIMEMSDGYLIE